MTLPIEDVIQAEIINIEMALVERLRSDRIRVPPYPAVAIKLQRMIDDPRTNSRALVELVGSDATLAAAVLRDANSAAAIGSVPVSTLDAAIARVGARGVLELAVALTVGKSATATGPLSALRRDVWRSALVSARVCQTLAASRAISPDQAFLAGLLHDFGAVVLVATLEDVANTRRLAVLPEHAWHDLVTRFHVEFGMIVAERWKLPAPIAEVMTRHHDRDALAGKGLVALVALSDQIVGMLDRGVAMASGTYELPGLATSERTALDAMLSQIGRQLASMEESMPSAAKVVAAPTLIERPSGVADGWPLELELTIRNESARVVSLWPDRFSFHLKTAVQPNWLAPIVLQCQPEKLDLLVNIRSCEPSPQGGYVVVAQPYALAGPLRSAWQALVEGARRHAPAQTRSA